MLSHMNDVRRLYGTMISSDVYTDPKTGINFRQKEEMVRWEARNKQKQGGQFAHETFLSDKTFK